MKYLLAALVAALILVPSAAAKKKPAPTTGSSISQPIVLIDYGTPGLSYGDTIGFTVSTDATADPFVNVNCYQNGVLVMNSWSAFFPGGTRQNFGFYSPVWQSGAADCQADLGMLDQNGSWTVLASSSFSVSG